MYILGLVLNEVHIWWAGASSGKNTKFDGLNQELGIIFLRILDQFPIFDEL